FTLPDTGRRTREIEIWPQAFRAGDGRMLGVRLGRIGIEPAGPPLAPPPAMVVALLVPALLVLVLGARARVAAGLGLAVAFAVLLVQAAMLWPRGLVHSAYAPRLAALLGLGTLVAFGFARAVARRRPDAAGAAFIALLAGWV